MGAIGNRLTTDWILAGIQSADQEVRSSLKVLKARSRELGRNNPHAIRYLQLKGDNVIGEDGILLQADVRDLDGEPAQKVNQAIEDAWNEWCEVGICTADGRSCFQDVERTSVIEEARDGDCFIRLLPAWRNNRFGFALQLIDPDQIDVDFMEPGGFDSKGAWRNEIRMGIEIDRWGRAVAFHIWTGHPSEPSGRDQDRTRVPADQMIHWFRPYRVGQTRGVPDFAPVLLTIKMLAGYEESELVASRIAAAKGGFFEKGIDAVNATPLPGEDGKKTFTMEVEPGLFESLPVGWKFAPWDPKHPTDAFPAFHKAMLRTIATGLGVSYNVLSQDWESTSFSSSRMDERASRPTYAVVQQSLLRHVHNQVYREWLKWAVTTGALELPTRNPRDYYRCVWRPRGWEGVDRVKDAAADAAEVELGINSRTRIAAARGRNLEDVFQELAKEQQLAAELGISISNDEVIRAGGRRSDDDEEDDENRRRNGSRLGALLNGARNGSHES